MWFDKVIEKSATFLCVKASKSQPSAARAAAAATAAAASSCVTSSCTLAAAAAARCQFLCRARVNSIQLYM